MGLEETRRSKSPRGSELVFLKAPESEELIEICSFPASGPVQVQPDLTHLAFSVDSLEGFGRHLESLGLKYSDGPTMRPGGGGFAFIDAPEGYEIELIESSKSAGKLISAARPGANEQWKGTQVSEMKKAAQFSIVLVTAPDRKVARQLAGLALKGRLAACANLIPAVESHYWWRGKIERGAEVLVIFKRPAAAWPRWRH